MQFSLKTLMLLAVILAIAAAFVSRCGGINLLYALVSLQVAAVIYGFTQIPIRPAVANTVLVLACLTHFGAIYFLYPLAEAWTNQAMYAAAERGYQIQMDEDEMHGFVLLVGTVLFGYLPVWLFLIFLWLIYFHRWQWKGMTRLVVSLWLLLIPFVVTWLSIRTYTSY